MRKSSLKCLMMCALVAVIVGACAQKPCPCASAGAPSVQPANSPGASEGPENSGDETEVEPVSLE
jgi:hypothetical protein